MKICDLFEFVTPVDVAMVCLWQSESNVEEMKKTTYNNSVNYPGICVQMKVSGY